MHLLSLWASPSHRLTRIRVPTGFSSSKSSSFSKAGGFEYVTERPQERRKVWKKDDYCKVTKTSDQRKTMASESLSSTVRDAWIKPKQKTARLHIKNRCHLTNLQDDILEFSTQLSTSFIRCGVHDLMGRNSLASHTLTTRQHPNDNIWNTVLWLCRK